MVPLNLRKKIFLSYLLLFIVFILFMYPFAATTVKRIMIRSMDERVTDLIEAIRGAENDDQLVQKLKEQQLLIFFRASIITNEKAILYDTYARRLTPSDQGYEVQYPEVLEAFAKGSGYHEEYSELLGQEFSYFAKKFPFHGKTYVLRAAFPYKYVAEIINNFEIGFLLFATAILLLFSIVTWIIINQLISPINDIIKAIKPYEEGKEITIPEIHLDRGSDDEFGRLAGTLNSLSKKIQTHINTIIHERNEKASILQSLGEGVIAINEENLITYSNGMAEKMLLGIEEEIVGKTLSSLSQPICEEPVEACHRENQVTSGSFQVKREGKRFYFDMIAVPIPGEAGAVLVIQDQTTYHQMMEMRKTFTANASHELKTPLTIIGGYAETLHDHPDLSPEMRGEITRKIIHNTTRMTNLVKDLLILSDVENIPQTRIISCDLLALAEKCKETIQTLFPTATIIVDPINSGPFVIFGDPDLLELALMNLMENAGKYSQAPAHISVSLKKKENTIEIDVADHGIGIPAADLENIFQRFYTVDKAHSRKMGGSGLGLSIVETIIEKHGGKIRAESQLHVGTTFHISLPIQRHEMNTDFSSSLD